MDNVPPIPIWKKFLFGIIALILFIAVTELALTLIGVKPLLLTEDPFVGFAGDIPLFAEHVQPDGTIMYATAENKLGFFNKQQFPKVKSTGSFRIFCMGGSTTYGHPFFDSTSFCGWLREFLPAADPSRNWELINAGGISYASYRVSKLMNELSQYQPDLFIIYSGHNEFLEERTYHSIKGLPRWIINTKAALANTRTYSILNRVLDRTPKKWSAPAKQRYIMKGEVDEILGRTVGPTSYTRDDLLRSEIIKHYEFNLSRMVTIAKSAGSRIIFITPASKIKDMRPFKSENSPGITDTERSLWSSLYKEGKDLQKSGNLTEALATFNDAARIDSRYADLHFRIGQVLFDLNRYEEAKISFQKAIDEDICPLRILSPMSKAVREVANENSVPLIDFVKLIDEDCEQRYGHKIPGDEFFLDHVHTSVEGYRLLGLSLLNELARQGIARTGPQWGDSAIAAVTQEVEQRHSSSKMRIRSLDNLASTMNWSGMFEETDNLLLRELQTEKEDKNKGLIYDILGRLSLKRGDGDKAIEYWYKALPSWPDNIKLRSTLAGLLQKKGRLDEALTQNHEILRIFDDRKKNPVSAELALHDPISVEDIVNVRSTIAQILSVQGRTKEAITHYSEVLKLKPDFAKAHLHLGMILNEQGKLDEAIVHYTEVLKIEPDSVEGHNNLGVAFAKQGKVDKAVSYFSSALKIDPGYADAHKNMGLALAILGRKKESDFHIFEAQRINAASTVRNGEMKH